MMVEEISAAAFSQDGKGVAIAVGEEAAALAGRAPGEVSLVKPVRGGAIGDISAASEMIRGMFRKAMGPRRWYKSVGLALVPVPLCISEVQRRALEQAVKQAGADEVWLEDAGWAAALGAGLPLDKSVGSMIINIGAGTTMAAVYSLDGQVSARAMASGGDAYDEAIAQYIRWEHQIAINDNTAREIKLALADAYAPVYDDTFPVRGRDVGSGLPATLEIGATEIYSAMEEQMDKLFDLITQTLAETPPELAGDVLSRGAVLCGGGALLKGLPRRIEEAIHIPVRVAASPREAVVTGGEILLGRGIKYLQRKAGYRLGKRVGDV
jgi:rod shape-determining protein MreB